MTVVLRPGEVSLADWRAVLAGAPVTVDPSSHARVAASAAAVERILARGEPVYGINTGFGKLATVSIAEEDLAQLQRNIVLSHAAGVGEPTPVATTRLMMALKLGSLAQGASGVQPQTLRLIEAMLARGLTPVIPSQGSVGASGDLAPLAHMAAAMIGVGEARVGNRVAPAAAALTEVGLEPIALEPKEGLALLNGTQFSTANALVGLFKVETLFRSALATGALSTDGARGSDTPFDARIHALRRHAGQIEVAAALRALLQGSAIRASHLTGDERVQDPYCLRCQPQVMGACLDLLRQAAATLLTEANGVSDNPLIFAETDEALSGGNFHAEPVAFAADMIALADLRNRLARRAPDRDARRSRAFRPAGVSDPEARAQFRIHDGASDRGGARRREQDPRLSGERQFDPDLGQPGRSRLDGRAWRAPARPDSGQRHGDHRHRAHRRRPGVRFS